MTIQPENSNLNYSIDPKFTKVNRLFVLSFEKISGENNTTKDLRDSFSHYHVPKAKIKDNDVLIDGTSSYDLPVKNEGEAYEKIIEMSKNNNYTTGNLLDFPYFKENYGLIAIDLSKRAKLNDPHQINFIGKLEGQNRGATVFLIIKNSEETTFGFLQNSVNIL